VTQVGGGRGAVSGGPVAGEILAERYQLEHHLNNDRAGRQIWYGVDVVLRRPVGLVIHYPGGPAAGPMLQSAVEVSRIVHPNLVGVYDAIDEQARAYVVREWVDGASLRDHVSAGPFDPERAVAVAHAVAAAATAVHSTGMSHGNIHPGTVLIGRDGRVVLSDARVDTAAGGEEDVRAVGAVLYYALTGYWPHAEVEGPRDLADAPRDSAGGLASPAQVRAGIPDFLDNLTMDLLDRRLGVPPAEILAGELARLDSGPAEPYYQDPDTGPVRLTAPDQVPAVAASNRKIVLGVGALVVIAVLGLFVGLRVLTGGPAGPSGSPPGGSPGTTGTPSAPLEASPTPLALTADQVRIVDPPPGSRSELDGVAALVDGDQNTYWRSETYWDGLQVVKPGLGILINLGEPRQIASVRVELSTSGAELTMRVGDSDPGNTSEGDALINDTYTTVGEFPRNGSTLVFSGFDSETSYQYLLVWFTELPPAGEHFRAEVLQVTVEGF
jgi:eukaryotic-like serine/threonine-protein kinase